MIQLEVTGIDRIEQELTELRKSKPLVKSQIGFEEIPSTGKKQFLRPLGEARGQKV